MKARPIISSVPFALCLLLVIAVINPDGSAAFYQRRNTKTTQVPPATKDSTPVPPPQGQSTTTRANNRTATAPRASGRAAAVPSDEGDEPRPNPSTQTTGAPPDDNPPRVGQNASGPRSQSGAVPNPSPSPTPTGDWIDTMFSWGLLALGVLGVLLVL